MFTPTCCTIKLLVIPGNAPRRLHMSGCQTTKGHKATLSEMNQYRASDYMVLDQLLFKITKDRITQKFKPLLCIPTAKINLLLHYFHSSLLGSHMGMTKTYVTISQRFFCPNLAHHIRAYIVGCHICQVAKQPKDIK